MYSTAPSAEATATLPNCKDEVDAVENEVPDRVYYYYYVHYLSQVVQARCSHQCYHVLSCNMQISNHLCRQCGSHAYSQFPSSLNSEPRRAGCLFAPFQVPVPIAKSGTKLFPIQVLKPNENPVTLPSASASCVYN